MTTEIKKTMRAAVLHEFGQPFTIEEIPTPEPGEGEVLVKVEASGVCHSDLHLADGDYPQMMKHRVEPTVLGHETVGIVVAKGPKAEGIEAGDRVGVGWLCHHCGECDFCQEGDDNLCNEARITGVAISGGYAEYFAVGARQAVKIPKGLDPVQAAPLFCAGVTVFRGLKKLADLGPGQRIGVFGIGGLGHLAVQLVKSSGAETIAVDVAADKLELASAFGADRTFLADEAVEKIQALGGLHAAIVTAATKAAYDTAIRCLRKSGTMVVAGLPSEPLSILPVAIAGAELHLVGSAVGSVGDIREVLNLAAENKLRCRIETAALDDINKIFDRLRQGTVTGRVVLTF